MNFAGAACSFVQTGHECFNKQLVVSRVFFNNLMADVLIVANVGLAFTDGVEFVDKVGGLGVV